MHTTLSRRARQAALERIVADYAPPGFLLTADGEIVHLFGDAGTLLPMHEDVVGGRIIDLIRPELRAVLSAALQGARRPGFERCARRVYLSGASEGDRATPCDLTLAPIDTGDDGPVFVLLSIAREASSRLSEERVTGLAPCAPLGDGRGKELAEHCRSLYRSVPVVMCLSDADGLLAEVSDEWLVHFGGDRSTNLGKPFVDVLVETDRDEAREAIRLGVADDLSLGVRRADGGSVEHELSCRACDIGTLSDMRLIVLSDVSERNRAMEVVEGQNRRLAYANENLNRFAFVASHDLQEPLRKIQQFSSFLAEDLDGTLDEDSRYHLKVIVDAAERMSALIRDLLQYSRTSRDALNRESVSLDALVDQVRRDLDLALEESGGRLQVGDLPHVSGDPMLLTQLFTNLIGNAIKYRSDTRPPQVRVWSEDGEKGRRIVVEDNGIGFDPLHARKMFDPFTRLHDSKEYRGSGIGLAICATVCDKHGWRIEADGDLDRGSRFTITLGPSEAAGGTGA